MHHSRHLVRPTVDCRRDDRCGFDGGPPPTHRVTSDREVEEHLERLDSQT
jgi:hypothetical protein